MTFALNSDEQNGVSIAVNTILKSAFNIGETEDWSAVADEWWNTPRAEHDGKAAVELLADSPEVVVGMALDSYKRAKQQQVGIYVMPTEEGLPPRAAFLVEIVPGMQAALGGVAYTEGAWRYPNGEEVEEELAQAITEHAEELGVEWDH